MGKFEKAIRKAVKISDKDFIKFPLEDESHDEMIGGPTKNELNQNEICITYSNTCVCNVPDRVFRRNKILSIFSDHETASHFKILRNQIMNKLEGIKGSSILITSPKHGEGKTFTSINLGATIAKELHRTVLIIDADLKKHLNNHHCEFGSDFFGLNFKKGLSDCLLGRAEVCDVLVNPGVAKLTVLPAGISLPNSTEVLSSTKMQSLMAEIKSRYPDDRFIIIDSPPINICADPIVLSRYVDGILLIVEAETTTRQDLKRTMNLIKENKIEKPIVGMVYNKNRERTSGS